jgi:hypothetical protein
VKPTGDPIDNLNRPGDLSPQSQRSSLDLLKQLNTFHQQQREGDSELTARIESFELAYRMQVAAPEALDLSQETQATQTLYGIDDPQCEHFAKQCLTARRLLERGVRFVQIYSGGMENQRSWTAIMTLRAIIASSPAKLTNPSLHCSPIWPPVACSRTRW